MDIENPKAVPRLVIGIPLYLSELYVIECGRYGAFADSQASTFVECIYASKDIL
jgi:hypothetical protein